MSRDIWFISDTHFGHRNIISYCRPQFESLEQMESDLIDNWNDNVKPQDLVYHLGDFAWKASDAIRVRPKLNGTIRLVVGNHDDITAYAKAGIFQRISMWRQFRDHNFTASHLPMRADQLRYGAFNLHGHVHGKTDGLEWFHRDVSVESIRFTPLHFDEVAARTTA